MVFGVSVPESLIRLACAKAGTDTEAPSDGDALATDKAMAQTVAALLLTPKSISESGFSITADKDALKTYYRSLLQRTGQADEYGILSQITDASDLW